MIRIGSLFSGIGGLELGLERAIPNAHTLFQVEIDPWCRKVLAKHWPETLRFDDVRSVGKHNLPEIDLLCGGFPCQDISIAGTGKGLAGDRSGLWFEYLRVIQETRPKIVVIENSPMLRSRGLVTVLQGLAESGYDAEWDCITAAAVGAPHKRERIVVIAYANGLWELQPSRSQPNVGGRVSDSAEENPQPTSNPLRKRILTSDRSNGSLHDQERDSTKTQEGRTLVPSELRHNGLFNLQRRDWSSAPPPFRGVDDVVPRGLDRRRLKALGNAAVVKFSEVVGLRVSEILQERFPEK